MRLDILSIQGDYEMLMGQVKLKSNLSDVCKLMETKADYREVVKAMEELRQSVDSVRQKQITMESTQ